jgi:hypothetical protein
MAETFVWVPDSWTRQDLDQAVRGARTAYRADLQKAHELFMSAAPPDPGWWPDWAKKHPELTVAASQATFEQLKGAYTDYIKRKDELAHAFTDYLKKEGCLPWYSVEREDEPMVAKCDWGHSHGQHFTYDHLEVADWPAPLQRNYEDL